MNDNRVTLTIYSSGTTVATDPAGYLRRATGLRFGTIFPGGLFASLECFIPCDPAAPFPFAAGQRIVARNGLTVVWEGVITGLGFTVGREIEQGVRVTATGYWGQLLERRYSEKRWADNVLTEARWVSQNGNTGTEKVVVDRSKRIRFTPKGVAWTLDQMHQILYSMPTGETVKRVACSFDMQEGGQAWELSLYNVTGVGYVWQKTASGTGTQDDTFATPSNQIALRIFARAGQTPVEDGTYYGEISGVMVYSETGTITAQSVAQNVRAKLTELNADETQLGAPGFTLEPFMTEGRESMASILMRAASYGDGSFNSWAPYLLESDVATTPNGKPVLALTQYPSLASFDYAIRIDEPNLEGPLTVVYDTDSVRNWIAVHYRDELDNRDILITPDDDANLKDTTSITTYGQREEVLDAGVTSATIAKNLARRRMSYAKSPRFYVSGSITVRGSLRAASGARVPASEIRAGKRIKIENYLTDLASVTGAGLTFYVTQTDYDDTEGTCAISTGVPDDLSVFMAQLALRTA